MNERRSLGTFLAPRYWPTWIGLGILRAIVLLPHRVRLGIGRSVGRIAHAVSGSRRAVVRRNLELCFPALDIDGRNRLAKRHFEALGMSLVEMGMARWLPLRKAKKLIQLEGAENLTDITDSGRGAILLTAHFTTLEFSGIGLKAIVPVLDAVYRKNRSDFITEILRTGRERSADTTIEKREIRQMIRSLRKGHVVWYAPDQSFDRKGAVVVEFFGTPCTQTPATSELARLGNAAVIPYIPHRRDDGSYEMRILPALENFPSGDPVADTQRYNAILEEHIAACPEQYFWVHRKFKNLPDDYPDYYADLDAPK